MAEDPRYLDRLVARRPPQFFATRRVAGHLEVTATSRLGSLTVAWIPADSHRAGPPWVMAAALLRKSRPPSRLGLDHARIQTRDRWRLEAPAGLMASNSAGRCRPVNAGCDRPARRLRTGVRS